MENRITTEITDMNENGVGIAKIDGCIVFVSGAVTGDICEIAVTERKKNFSLGEILSIVTPSPLRCDSGCTSYSSCGGCSLRHISFDAENQIKRQTVVNAFRRARLKDIPVKDTLHTGEEKYRNKTVLHFSDGKFGYYSEKTNKAVHILPCPLLPDSINEIGAYVNDSIAGLKGIGFSSLYLRTSVKGDVSVVFGLDTKQSAEKLMKSGFIPALVSRFPQIVGILSEIKGNHSVLFGERELSDTLSGLRFTVSPEGFWQVNNSAAEILAAKVTEYAEAIDFDSCIDLYCGSGTFGLILAAKLPKTSADSKKERVYYGVELNERSISDAKRNAAENGIDNIRFFCGDAADFRKKMDPDTLGNSLVIIDPPRAGCSDEMLKNLTELSPKNIIYISCSPNTLARDCAKLAESGYTVEEATPVNMFPRTKHCETVAILRK